MFAKAGLSASLSLFVSLFSFSSIALAERVVGNTATDFSVSGGSVNYTVPIHVAPGRGGMQPELSFNYHGGGNGILGEGWGLGGLSSIHRCTATLEQDGFVGRTSFSHNDRYCLDGQRLVPVNGGQGGVGTEYRLETDSYSRIISYGGTAYHPDHFIAHTKAGQVIRFGGGNASLSFPGGTTTWSVNTITDTTGANTITFDYFIESRNQYLSTITYPGGRVDIDYTRRADQPVGYYQGSSVQQARRLLQLTSYHGNSVLRRYTPMYDNRGADARSYLTGIAECASNDDCYTTIHFEL